MVMIKPKCDFCKQPAIFDTQTVMGPWANVCQEHFDKYSSKVPGLYSSIEPIKPVDKLCVVCHEVKPLSEFYEYTDNKSGVRRLRGECKDCNLAQKKKLSFKKK
jgi:hypothetical protein